MQTIRIGLSLLTATLLGCSPGGGDSGTVAGDRNCSDFSCQQDAQAWHEQHPEHGLDADNDNIACEHLPSCSTLPAHTHLALPALPAKTTRTAEGLLDYDNLTGHFSAVSTDRTAKLDLLLTKTDIAETRHIQGLVRWGEEPEATGEIVRGEVLGNIAWLECAYATKNQADTGTFPILLNLESYTGTIIGSEFGLSDLSEFVILARHDLKDDVPPATTVAAPTPR